MAKSPVNTAAFTVQTISGGAIKIADAARLLGVTRQAIDAWVADGLPLTTAGGKGSGDVKTIHLGDVIEWKEDRILRTVGAHGTDGDQHYNEVTAKAKAAHYKAMILQIQALEKWRLCCPVDVIGPVIDERNARIRSIAMGMPSSLSTRISAESDPAKCYNMILAEVTEFLKLIQSGRDVAIAAGLDPDGSVDAASIAAAVEAAQLEMDNDDSDLDESGDD